MTAGTRVVVLTGTGPQHLHVANALAATGLLAAVMHDDGVPRSRKDRLGSSVRRFGVGGLAQRMVTKAVLRASGEAARRSGQTARLLPDQPLPAAVPQHHVRGVNSPAARALLAELDVDVLCVYGTTVVHDDTLALAKDLALNLHTGISPYYRGADCAFWPLHEAEPHMLGATVHECTSRIDGGDIFGIERAAVGPEDGVGAVFARCVIAGAEAYARVLQDVVSGQGRPVPQDPALGREFRAAMRTGQAERRVHRLLADGLLRDYVAAGRPDEWPPGART